MPLPPWANPPFDWPLPTTAPIDRALYRSFYLEEFRPWDRCTSCGEPIRPPELFYDHPPTGQVAHVRPCTVEHTPDV